MVERTPRLVGEARQAMAAELAGRYHDGASIRPLHASPAGPTA